MSGGVGGLAGAIPLARPDPDAASALRPRKISTFEDSGSISLDPSLAWLAQR